MSHALRVREIIDNLNTALDTEDVDSFAVVLDDLDQLAQELEATDELTGA